MAHFSTVHDEIDIPFISSSGRKRLHIRAINKTELCVGGETYWGTPILDSAGSAREAAAALCKALYFSTEGEE